MKRIGMTLFGGVLAAIAIGLGALTLTREAHPGQAASTPSSSVSCEDLNPPCPPMKAPIDLLASEDHSLAGWVLAPAPKSRPALEAQDVLEFAWLNSGLTAAKSVQPIYALLPAGGTEKSDRAVWLMKFEGVCILPHGAAGDDLEGPPQCAGNKEFDVIIDANTGAFIAGFTDR